MTLHLVFFWKELRMIIRRPYWQNLIEEAWKERTLVWLMGIRRVGKTSLCKSLPNITYFDCELPRTRQLMADPEEFLASQMGKRIVLDEIHRLENPSELLKIAADHYPEVHIIATGSSTLGASAHFKDTLTGRKRQIWLTPLLLEEMPLFGSEDIRHRFLFGGLPFFFEQTHIPEEDFKEWLIAYWAKDIQDMFRVGKRHSFLKCAQLLMVNSGGLFEATKYADACEISRETVGNYLEILEETFIVHVVRPYSSHKKTEIVKAPKVYGFDTGFVCYARGWRELRPADTGILWEHCVLNELHAALQDASINYWRNKKGNEIDFVLQHRAHNSLTAIECKFSLNESDFGPSSLKSIAENFEAFRSHYPIGENYVVAHDLNQPFTRKYHELDLTFIPAKELRKIFGKQEN